MFKVTSADGAAQFLYILVFEGQVWCLRSRLWWKTSTGSSSQYFLGRRTRSYFAWQEEERLTQRLMHEADCIVS